MKPQVYEFNNKYCDCNITITKKNNREFVNVKGNINETVYNNELLYLASAPTGHINSFSGSGLPFPNKDIAYLDTPNKGHVDVHFRRFEFNLLMPNSYYIDMGNKLVKPTLLIKYSNGEDIRIFRIPVGNQIPFRSQMYPKQRTGPNFYSSGWNMPIRSQENILLDSSYPKFKKMSDNHWGLKPSI
jgi:hypothetical protein